LKRWHWWAIGSGLLVVLLVATGIGMALVELPYYAVKPGSVRATASAITVDGAVVHQPEQEIGYVTVTVADGISAWEWLESKFDDNIDIIHEDQITGGRSADEKRQVDRLRMQQSKDVATLVALDYLGYEITTIGLGVEVAALTPCMPAEDVLEVADLIIGVGGNDVEFGTDLTDALGGMDPGDTVSLTVERVSSGEVEVVEVELGSSADSCLSEDARTDLDGERALIGITMNPIIDYDVPINIEIDSGSVGGPSAGLAFTLSVIDVLTPGELTGGLKVATTGTMAIDGSVGPVGGVKQKTVAVDEAAIELFLVPSSEFEEASATSDGATVIAVDTIDEAVDALEAAGGGLGDLDDLPSELAGG
jgi:PDZ domain-containing protein